MDVVSFRVPRELKKAMKEVDINWSEEIRKFIEKKIKEFEKKRVLDEIDAMLANVPEARKGTTKSYVREDRDSN